VFKNNESSKINALWQNIPNMNDSMTKTVISDTGFVS